RLDKILANNEIKNLVIALGAAIAQDFDIEKTRYHRIIIMSDADVDGSHIRTLLLTLFYRYFKPLIERGYLYIAQPPLYKIQAGKRQEYAYTEEDKDEILLDIDKNKVLKDKIKLSKKETDESQEKAEQAGNPSLEEEVEVDNPKRAGVNVQRYKGLGEMNPEELWETTMNPSNRILLQVNIEDAKMADQMFDTLMGKEVLPRKKFIQAHAKKVKNLDI
ncbi:MAG: toprim domain-containing protein, partial [bacterium]|nr:toprim domain-containing protein [bacterium]